MMANRKGISNKLRFEIFKRDSFKCQYCGRSAPDVILHVDHIDPVSKGGKNDILNLITSCFECNNGKSDRKISDNSAVSLQKKQLDELNERREQLNMLIEWKTLLEDKSYEIDSIVNYFNKKFDSTISLTDYGKKNLTVQIKKYGADKVLDSINSAYEKYFGLMKVEEIWDKLESVLNFINASENDRNKMKFFGGIKGRFKDDNNYTKWKVINTNIVIRKLFDVIDSGVTTLSYSDLFDILNKNTWYSYFSRDIDSLYDEVCKIL